MRGLPFRSTVVDNVLQRYRKDRRPKQFRLGVMAPLPAYFVELCRRFEIPLEEKFITGGVYIDEEPATTRALENIGGKWLP